MSEAVILAVLVLVGLLVVWACRRAALATPPRPRPPRRPPSANERRWRRRALWFAIWWTFPCRPS